MRERLRTTDTPVGDGGLIGRPRPHICRVTILYGVVDTSTGNGISGSFEMDTGETILLAEHGVRFSAQTVIEEPEVQLMLDWPGSGPVTLRVALTPLPDHDGSNAYDARILAVH